MTFKDDLEKYPQPGPEREKFILNKILSLPKEQIVKNLKPITISQSDGSSIIYKIMPDYLSIDNIRIPMSGKTAQIVADHFGLSIPTPKLTDDIYRHSDVQIDAYPLSGTGVKLQNGTYFSPKQVVDKGVGYAPFVNAYNERINKQLSDNNVKPNQIVSGFCKDITTPQAPGKLGLYGFFRKDRDKPIQYSAFTPHDIENHSEYGAFLRLISPDVEVVSKDGSIEKKNISEVQNITRYTAKPSGTTSLLQLSPKYPTGTTQSPQSKPSYTAKAPQQSPSGRQSFLSRIDSFISQFNI
jgi:hypothetical protein